LIALAEFFIAGELLRNPVALGLAAGFHCCTLILQVLLIRLLKAFQLLVDVLGDVTYRILHFFSVMHLLSRLEVNSSLIET